MRRSRPAGPTTLLGLLAALASPGAGQQTAAGGPDPCEGASQNEVFL